MTLANLLGVESGQKKTQTITWTMAHSCIVTECIFIACTHKCMQVGFFFRNENGEDIELMAYIIRFITVAHKSLR